MRYKENHKFILEFLEKNLKEKFHLYAIFVFTYSKVILEIFYLKEWAERFID